MKSTSVLGGFHIKIHGNPQILTSPRSCMAVPRQKLTTALTFGVIFRRNWPEAGFYEFKLL